LRYFYSLRLTIWVFFYPIQVFFYCSRLSKNVEKFRILTSILHYSNITRYFRRRFFQDILGGNSFILEKFESKISLVLKLKGPKLQTENQNVYFINRYYNLVIYRKDLSIPNLDDDSLDVERQFVNQGIYWEREERYSK